MSDDPCVEWRRRLLPLFHAASYRMSVYDYHQYLLVDIDGNWNWHAVILIDVFCDCRYCIGYG